MWTLKVLEWKCTGGKAAGSSLILDLGSIAVPFRQLHQRLAVPSLSGLSQVPQNSLCSLIKSAGCPGNWIQ
jgi:hypothetical protein